MKMNVKFFSGEEIPLETYKIKFLKNIELENVDDRLKNIVNAGFNTYFLNNKNIFLDMLTDSGVNALSNTQLASYFTADDTFAFSESFDKLKKTTENLFNKKYLLLAHQGRAAENIIFKTLVKQGDFIPMNICFSTSRNHIQLNGGTPIELLMDEGLDVNSDFEFKGNIDINKLRNFIKNNNLKEIPFVRMEICANLIGGQPVSIENVLELKKVCDENNLPLILDASLLGDNLYFIKTREKKYENLSTKEILKIISEQFDIIYFSARKFGNAKGACILFNNEKYLKHFWKMITTYEGFITDGGMSLNDIESLNIGLEENMEMNMIKHNLQMIEYLTKECKKNNIPISNPAGCLGLHINTRKFMSHIPIENFRSTSFLAAFYIISGIRGMENDIIAQNVILENGKKNDGIELARLGLPRRVYSLSQMKFLIDRLNWLYKNKDLIGGVELSEKTTTPRYFLDKFTIIGDWHNKLVDKFKKDLKSNF